MQSVTDEFLDAWEKYGSDPLVWRQYVFAEAAHRDYLLNLKAEREEGREEAGRKIAFNLREQGILTDEQVAQVVNLPVNPVEIIDTLDDFIPMEEHRDNIAQNIHMLEVFAEKSVGHMK